MPQPHVTLTIIFSAFNHGAPSSDTQQGGGVPSAPGEVVVVPNVSDWDVVGSFLTYKVGGATTVIPNTRIFKIEVES
jgi:hypothetical protein